MSYAHNTLNSRQFLSATNINISSLRCSRQHVIHVSPSWLQFKSSVSKLRGKYQVTHTNKPSAGHKVSTDDCFPCNDIFPVFMLSICVASNSTYQRIKLYAKISIDPASLKIFGGGEMKFVTERTVTENFRFEYLSRIGYFVLLNKNIYCFKAMQKCHRT